MPTSYFTLLPPLPRETRVGGQILELTIDLLTAQVGLAVQKRDLAKYRI